MTEQDKQIVIEALEYALNDCPIKDGDYQTHFNTFANAIEIVKNCSIPNVVGQSEQLKAFVSDVAKGFDDTDKHKMVKKAKELLKSL